MSSTSSGRRELLSRAQRAQLLSLPISLGELEKFYTLTPADLDFRETHWRQGQHKTDQRALGRDPAAWRLHLSGHGYRIADAAQARGLSTPERVCHRAAELGKLERTLFLLRYIRDVELRRRIHIGLNKEEARNALARAVFFNRLGELRDRTLENQQHRASGLNLVVAAIVLWNTVYLDRAVQALRKRGQMIPEALLVHLSPLKWEHINMTGDYHWRRDGGLRNRKSRPLRNALA